MNASEIFGYSGVMKNTRSVGWLGLGFFLLTTIYKNQVLHGGRIFFPLQDSLSKLTGSKYKKIGYVTFGFINSS